MASPDTNKPSFATRVGRNFANGLNNWEQAIKHPTKFKFTRRGAGDMALVGAATVLSVAGVVALGSQAVNGIESIPFENFPHNLQPVGNTLLDRDLFERKNILISFSYDPTYIDPNFPTAGSLVADICSNMSQQVRVASKEVAPHPGWLVNKTFSLAAECVYPHPVTGLNPGDRELIYIGFGTPDMQSITSMRAYEIDRTQSGLLFGKFLGIQTVPTNVQPRNSSIPTPTSTSRSG